jgi:N-acetylmuramic acid 6-phosphate etherase
MNTEKKSERYDTIDLWEIPDIFDALLESQLAAVNSVARIKPEMEHALKHCVVLLHEGGRLIFAGAGTSGRLAAQEAAELYPTFSWPQKKAIYLIAGGTRALTESVEHVEDDLLQGERDAQKCDLTAQDVVVCLGASGRTPYTLGVLRVARERGAFTIAVSCVLNAPLLNEAQVKFFLDTGAEVVAGSTRMKAGTAQKIVLNLFTTTLMILLKRVYRSYMVNLVATNRKLRSRAIKMVAILCDVSFEKASQVLDICQGEVKLACLFLKYKDLDIAKKILEEAKGDLRKCLGIEKKI